MIDFRYHLVSLIAVFLALSVGIVLGSTMLQDPLLDRLNHDAALLREEAEELRVESDLAQQWGSGADDLVEQHAHDMLADQLADTDVVMVAAPRSDSRLGEDLAARVEQADGELVGTVTLNDSYIEPGEDVFLGEMADRFAGEEPLPGGSPYERAAAVLARALVGDGEDAEQVLDEFDEVGLLGVEGQPEEGADVALVLAPAEPYAVPEGDGEGPEQPPLGNIAVLELARALGTTGSGAVLAGETASSASPAGLIGHARDTTEDVATVDTAGTSTGDVVTVFALSAVLDGHSGHWGVGTGAEGFLPEPLPRPRAEEEDPEAAET